jgi:hypothetical protein
MCALTDDPLPFLQGLYQLIPEGRLATILQRTGRQSHRQRRLPAHSVAWLVVAMGLFARLPIPQVWRRLHPVPTTPSRSSPPSPRLASASASPRCGTSSRSAPGRWLPTRVSVPSTAAGS